MSAMRNLLLVALLLAAVVLQAAVVSQVAILGVVPDLCLLVVLAAGLVRGREVGAVTGFFGGLALDLAPPADHVAGRWALAFAVVGYLAGEVVRSRAAPHRREVAAALCWRSPPRRACSRRWSSCCRGLLVHDRGASLADTAGVVLVAVALDAVVAMLVLPPLVDLLGRLRPARLAI